MIYLVLRPNLIERALSAAGRASDSGIRWVERRRYSINMDSGCRNYNFMPYYLAPLFCMFACYLLTSHVTFR